MTRGRALAMGFKALGFVLLFLCLTDPLRRTVRARSKANQLFVLVDESSSLSVREGKDLRERAITIRGLLAQDAPWLQQAERELEVRRFAFASSLRPFRDPSELSFETPQSSLAESLERLVLHTKNQPVAGVLLFSDGIANDEIAEGFDWGTLPAIYPVRFCDEPTVDVAVKSLSVRETRFEERPLTVLAELEGSKLERETILVELCDQDGRVVEAKNVAADGADNALRFEPANHQIAGEGASFLQVRARLASEAGTEESRREATLANNRLWVTFGQEGRKHRVLYVAGRPSFELKFLRRAMEEDPEVDLVALVRIAKREPRFTFREGGDRRNQLWDGFDNRDTEVGEQIDEPVLLRLGTRDEFELRTGFPKMMEELFAYDALILDDLEASFFTPEQLGWIERYVSERGGGFLMLGGESSYSHGGYEGTPLAQLLPVYLDVTPRDSYPARTDLRLELTREGWLEPWIRLRSTESMERVRLDSMPAFRTRNRARGIKPGGTVLIEAFGEGDRKEPALVTQRFGRGRSAALLMGDLWRWDLGREDPKESDLATAWRQLLRWLVTDVPKRLELHAQAMADPGRFLLTARSKDRKFEPQKSGPGFLEVRIQPPEGESFTLEALQSLREPGLYQTEFVAKQDGPYRAFVDPPVEAEKDKRVEDDGATPSATVVVGFVVDRESEEFSRLDPDIERLENIAEESGGRVLAPGELEDLVETLINEDAPIKDVELEPLWHKPWVLCAALLCLCAEWGLRRREGVA